MTRDEMQQQLNNDLKNAIDLDGCDAAYFDGIQHVLSSCGDGGISEAYLMGIQYALDNLDVGEIERFPGDNKYPTQLDPHSYPKMDEDIK